MGRERRVKQTKLTAAFKCSVHRWVTVEVVCGAAVAVVGPARATVRWHWVYFENGEGKMKAGFRHTAPKLCPLLHSTRYSTVCLEATSDGEGEKREAIPPATLFCLLPHHHANRKHRC